MNERAIRAIWARTPPGGYGYTQAVPALVLRRLAKRIRILVMRQSGELVERSVWPEHVRPADAEYVKRHSAIYDALEADKVEARP
jgi:hypothetical protein